MIVITTNEKYKDRETIEKVVNTVSYFDNGDWVYEQAIAGYGEFTKEGNVVLIKFDRYGCHPAMTRVTTKEGTLCLHVVGKLLYVIDRHRDINRVIGSGSLREFLIENRHMYKDSGTVVVEQEV